VASNPDLPRDVDVGHCLAASGAHQQKMGCHQRQKCREMHQTCEVHPSKIDLTQNNENIYSTPKWGCKSTNKICIWPFKKLDSKALNKWIYITVNTWILTTKTH